MFHKRIEFYDPDNPQPQYYYKNTTYLKKNEDNCSSKASKFSKMKKLTPLLAMATLALVMIKFHSSGSLPLKKTITLKNHFEINTSALFLTKRSKLFVSVVFQNISKGVLSEKTPLIAYEIFRNKRLISKGFLNPQKGKTSFQKNTSFRKNSLEKEGEAWTIPKKGFKTLEAQISLNQKPDFIALKITGSKALGSALKYLVKIKAV